MYIEQKRERKKVNAEMSFGHFYGYKFSDQPQNWKERSISTTKTVEKNE